MRRAAQWLLEVDWERPDQQDRMTSLVCSAGYQDAMYQRAQRFFKLMASTPYVFTNSNTESLQLYELIGGSSDIDQLLSLKLDYTIPDGEARLRQIIARQYDHISPEQVVVVSGAQEGIHHIAAGCLSPADHVIVQFPCYPPVLEMFTARGCRISLWHPIRHWQWEIEHLSGMIRRDTRLVFVNAPHNPTGQTLSRTMLTDLNRLAEAHELMVLSDEVYRHLEYDPVLELPPMADLNPQAVSVGSLSKALSVPGLRVGWLVSRNEQVIRRISQFKDRTTICNNRLGQLLATMVLQQQGWILARNRAIIQQNLAVLELFLQRFDHLFEWKKPVAGTVAFPRLRIDVPVESFCYHLARETGVMFWPGNLFYYGGHHFRVGFGHRHFPEGIQRLDHYFGNIRKTGSYG